MLNWAYTRIPYYKKPFETAGVFRTPEKIRLEALCDLPPVTKAAIRQHEELFTPQDLPGHSRVRLYHTGGTTGDPLVLKGDETFWDWYLASIWNSYEMMGLRIGMPYFYFWGAPQDLPRCSLDLKARLWIGLIQNRQVLNCSMLSEKVMAEHIHRINCMPSHRHMVAYVHELYETACFCLDAGLRVSRPFEGISTTTAPLTEAMRQTIETVFHGPVYSRYGSREIGDMACECPYQQGLHVNPMYVYLEVVDDAGHPLPYGEEGRILVTSLHNRLMPLVRYEVQDMGVLRGPSTCRCGHQWLTFEQITGRTREKLVLPDGSTFGNVFLHYAMAPLPDLRGYQLHQTALNRVEVHLLSPVENYLAVHRQAVEESRARFMQSTANQLQVTYHQVDALEKAPSGKRLVILNKIPAAGNEAPVSPPY